MVPNTCAGCKYAYTVSWYGGISTIPENYCQTRCDLKHREINMSDENCVLKETRDDKTRIQTRSMVSNNNG